LTREKHYREGLEASANLSADSDTQKWVESLPFKDMVRFGWVPSAQDLSEKVVASLRFFGVRDLSAWKQSYKSVLDSAVFRTSAAFRSKPGAVAAWLRRAEQESASIVCAPWDAKRLQQVLVEVRALTREPDPKVFLPHLKELLRPCGVAVVVLRAPDGCRASGATRFITANKALMLLSFRHLSDDQFWFSVLHEAGHLVLHKDRVMVDAPKMPSSKEEEEANVFAANVLVPPEFKAEMLRLPVNGREVMRFARRIGVSPGIVVGQMQYWHRLTHRQLNNLKRRYAWTDESKG
jgi:Zn-dependent peptidase ImmA (M78 family)